MKFELNRFNLLKFTMKESTDTLRINSSQELEERMFYYNCTSVQDLEDHLWSTYGITLIIEYEI